MFQERDIDSKTFITSSASFTNDMALLSDEVIKLGTDVFMDMYYLLISLFSLIGTLIVCATFVYFYSDDRDNIYNIAA